MIKKAATAILWIFLILLFIYDAIYIAASLVNERKSNTGADIVIIVLYAFVTLMISSQANVLLLLLLLIHGLLSKNKMVVFNRKTLFIFALNFAGVFIHIYSQLGKLFEGSQFAERAQNYYNLDYALVTRHTFLSNIYLIYGLGWYKITAFFNSIFNSVYSDDFKHDNYAMLTSANCCLSTVILICFLTCFLICRKR